MTERPGPRGLRIWFRPEPAAEKGLRALVAVETGCCPWGTWAVQTGPGHIVLGVRLAGAGIVACAAGAAVIQAGEHYAPLVRQGVLAGWMRCLARYQMRLRRERPL
jgi:hypothetical protein